MAYANPLATWVAARGSVTALIDVPRGSGRPGRIPPCGKELHMKELEQTPANLAGCATAIEQAET
jgi:hypothetical protein